MSFRADGTSVVRVTDGQTSGVAIAFDPAMARRIADALNSASGPGADRGKVDPLTGKTVDRLDIDDTTSLSEVIGSGAYVQITGPYATAQMNTPGGREIRALAAGAVLPADVTAGHARHLIDVGLAELVNVGAAQDAYGAGETGQAATSTGDAKPTSRSSKEEWVIYAVAQRPEGMSEEEARAEADATSKNELMAKYGNGSNGS